MTQRSNDTNWPLIYKWAAGADRGPLVATPYLGFNCNSDATGQQNIFNLNLWIDQVEVPYVTYQLLLQNQSLTL